MSKSSSKGKGKGRVVGQGSVKPPVGFQDHNLKAMDPCKAQEQFKPSPANPIRMHKQMAGDPTSGGFPKRFTMRGGA